MTDKTEATAKRARITMPELVSAGGEGAQEAARSLRGLGFDPHDYPVDSGALEEKLGTVDQVHVLNALQAFDTRITAAALYERRIKELAEAEEA